MLAMESSPATRSAAMRKSQGGSVNNDFSRQMADEILTQILTQGRNPVVRGASPGVLPQGVPLGGPVGGGEAQAPDTTQESIGALGALASQLGQEHQALSPWSMPPQAPPMGPPPGGPRRPDPFAAGPIAVPNRAYPQEPPNQWAPPQDLGPVDINSTETPMGAEMAMSAPGRAILRDSLKRPVHTAHGKEIYTDKPRAFGRMADGGAVAASDPAQVPQEAVEKLQRLMLALQARGILKGTWPPPGPVQKRASGGSVTKNPAEELTNEEDATYDQRVSDSLRAIGFEGLAEALDNHYSKGGVVAHRSPPIKNHPYKFNPLSRLAAGGVINNKMLLEHAKIRALLAKTKESV